MNRNLSVLILISNDNVTVLIFSIFGLKFQFPNHHVTDKFVVLTFQSEFQCPNFSHEIVVSIFELKFQFPNLNFNQ